MTMCITVCLSCRVHTGKNLLVDKPQTLAPVIPPIRNTPLGLVLHKTHDTVVALLVVCTEVA